MKALTPAAAAAVDTLRKISYSLSYEDAQKVRDVIELIKDRDVEIRNYREWIASKQSYEVDCG